jgi:hypothetical protein
MAKPVKPTPRHPEPLATLIVLVEGINWGKRAEAIAAYQQLIKEFPMPRKPDWA